MTTTSINLRDREQGQRIKAMLIELSAIYKMQGRKKVTQGDIVEDALKLLKQQLSGETPKTVSAKICEVLEELIEYLEEDVETVEDAEILEGLKKKVREIKENVL